MANKENDEKIIIAFKYLMKSKLKPYDAESAIVWAEALSHFQIDLVLKSMNSMVYKDIPFPQVGHVVDEMKIIVHDYIYSLYDTQLWIKSGVPQMIKDLYTDDSPPPKDTAVDFYVKQLIYDNIPGNGSSQLKLEAK
jgi:hypothetical protein